MNVYMGQPSIAKLTSLHFHAWKIGLKTGMYYLRTRPKADAIQFTVDAKLLRERQDYHEEKKICSIDDAESCCDACGA